MHVGIMKYSTPEYLPVCELIAVPRVRRNAIPLTMGAFLRPLLVLSSIACSNEPSAPLPTITREQLLAAMTPEAAVAVGQDGKLRLTTHIDTGREQISAQQAARLATPVAKSFLPLLASFFNEQRGKPIAYSKLVVCGDILYGEPTFERLLIDDSIENAHPLQKALGPWWLVKLCAEGGPQVQIAVSSYSTDLSISSTGDIVFPAIGGNDFIAEGIPVKGQEKELPTAEAAVVLAAELTGHRVSAVPRLILPFYMDDSPFGARWYIQLDAPSRMRNSEGKIFETSEIFISRIRATRTPGSRLWSADEPQPDFVEVTFVPLGVLGETREQVEARRAAGTTILHAMRRATVPVRFIPVS